MYQNPSHVPRAAIEMIAAIEISKDPCRVNPYVAGRHRAPAASDIRLVLTTYNELAFCCERSNKTRSRSERYRNYPRFVSSNAGFASRAPIPAGAPALTPPLPSTVRIECASDRLSDRKS